jgi:hypothetical protein
MQDLDKKLIIVYDDWKRRTMMGRGSQGREERRG